MEYLNIDINGTICCDECCEIVYNQFTCPICKDYEMLTVYENLDYETKEIQCETCGTKFNKHYADKEDSWYGINRIILVEN